MKFSKYWNELTEKQQQEFADSVGASVMTIKQKYMCPAHSREVPRKPRMEKMLEQSQPLVSRAEMFEHFYPSVSQDIAS